MLLSTSGLFQWTDCPMKKTTKEEISKSTVISLEGILNCWLPWELKQRRSTKSGQLSTERLCTLEIQKARTQKLWTLYVRNIKSQLFLIKTGKWFTKIKFLHWKLCASPKYCPFLHVVLKYVILRYYVLFSISFLISYLTKD